MSDGMTEAAKSRFELIPFKNCAVRYFPAADYLETVFPDGEKCPAQFRFDGSEYMKAVDLGYSVEKGMADAVTRMHLEHELAHTFIAEALGEPWCPVLRSVAVKGPCEGAWEREELVMGFQKALNGIGTIVVKRQWNDAPREIVREFKRRFRP